TLSDQKGGSLGYLSADIGFNLWRDPKFRLGAFAGYHYFNERVNAYGCTQIATNSSICGTSPVPSSVEVITQDNTWHSLRIGVDFDVKLSDRFKLRADAAYLPYVKLFGTDWHRLRIGTTPGDFAGGIPEDGVGRGYQLEAALSYAVNENVDIAIGGRYWHMESSGNTHFEGNIVGGGGCCGFLRHASSRFRHACNVAGAAAPRVAAQVSTHRASPRCRAPSSGSRHGRTTDADAASERTWATRAAAIRRMACMAAWARCIAKPKRAS